MIKNFTERDCTWNNCVMLGISGSCPKCNKGNSGCTLAYSGGVKVKLGDDRRSEKIIVRKVEVKKDIKKENMKILKVWGSRESVRA